MVATISVSQDKAPQNSSWKDDLINLSKHPYFAPSLQVFFLFLYLVIGCSYYYSVESWSVGTTLWFTVVTITTVGYGYHRPTTDPSRMFTIFYILFGVYFVFFTLSEVVMEQFSRFNKILKNQKSINQIENNYLYHRKIIFWNIVALILVIFIGALSLMSLEDWSFIEALYFAIETSTTVGYGDLEIKNKESTHAFLSFYIFLSVLLVAFAVNNFNMVRAERKQLKRFEDMMIKRQEMTFLSELDSGKGVTEPEFILAILEHLGVLNQEKDIKPWIEKFRSIDKSSSGKIFKKDLAAFSAQESITAKEEASRIENQLQKMPQLFSLTEEESDSLSLENTSSPMISTEARV